MKIIDRHLLREYLVPLSYSLFTFCMLYVVASLFHRAPEFAKAGVSVFDALYFYANYLVSCGDLANISFLVFVLPVSLLAGSLYSLSRLARNNELTALRAGGVSIYRLMCPFLAVALVCCVVGSLVQESLTPVANMNIDNFKNRIRNMETSGIVTDYNYYNRRDRRRWQVGALDLNRPERLRDVRVTEERADRSRVSRISAQRAVWADGHWALYGKKEQAYTPGDQPDGPEAGPETGPVVMSGWTTEPEDLVFEADRRRLEKHTGALRILEHLRRHSGVQDAELAILRVDAHTRLAMPWACLVVALLGIPVGAGHGRRGVFAGINLAVLMFLAYYLLIQAATFLGKKGLIWPWLSAWFSNIIFIGIGVVMLVRMQRH